jgi:AbrB family transcriptional regulator (stage V sporulation protein T)
MMKATGIVRRIDDLGRIVIPKEIRRTMHIREGDPLEMTLTDTERQLVFATSLVALRDRIGAA